MTISISGIDMIREIAGLIKIAFFDDGILREVVGLRDVAFSDVRIPSFSRFEKFVGRFRYQMTVEERRRQILMAAYSSVDV